MNNQGKSPKQYKDSAILLFGAFVAGWVMFMICVLTCS